MCLADPDTEQPPDTTIQTVTRGYCVRLYSHDQKRKKNADVHTMEVCQLTF